MGNNWLAGMILREGCRRAGTEQGLAPNLDSAVFHWLMKDMPNAERNDSTCHAGGVDCKNIITFLVSTLVFRQTMIEAPTNLRVGVDVGG
jgi:hypothetical protein